jgi:hypothetical protein
MHLVFFSCAEAARSKAAQELLYLLSQMPLLVVLAVSGLYLLRFSVSIAWSVFARIPSICCCGKDTVRRLIDLFKLFLSSSAVVPLLQFQGLWAKYLFSQILLGVFMHICSVA